MNPKEDFIKFIENSGLSEADKGEWKKTIQGASEDFAFYLLDVLSENPEELSWFNEIYKRKREAFELSKTNPDKARELLHEILEEEKTKINELNKEE